MLFISKLVGRHEIGLGKQVSLGYPLETSQEYICLYVCDSMQFYTISGTLSNYLVT